MNKYGRTIPQSCDWIVIPPLLNGAHVATHLIISNDKELQCGKTELATCS